MRRRKNQEKNQNDCMRRENGKDRQVIAVPEFNDLMIFFSLPMIIYLVRLINLLGHISYKRLMNRSSFPMHHILHLEIYHRYNRLSMRSSSILKNT